MFLKLKKELLLKYLFLFSLFFACAAGVCSAAFVLVTAILICGVVMTSEHFSPDTGAETKVEGKLFDLIFRFAVCGVAVIAVGISEGLTAWYSVIIYSVYAFCLSVKLVEFHKDEIKREEGKKRKGLRDVQEAAVTLLVPASYLFAALSRTVFAVIYYVILGVAAVSFLLRLRIKRIPKNLMFILAAIEGAVLVATLVFTLTGLFTA